MDGSLQYGIPAAEERKSVSVSFSLAGGLVVTTHENVLASHEQV